MLRQDHVSVSATNGSAIPAAVSCGNCGAEERRLLHNVRHRGIFRRLCTTCVLRLHPQSFCPTCFWVYHPAPPPSAPNDAVTCFKCYSSSHSQCVGPNPPSPYVCPCCINPNSPIFVLKKVKDMENSDNDGNHISNGNCRVIDKKSAKILLAAARIAAMSMSKAASAARAEAERRAKEAAFTRRRAREALEHVTGLVAKENMKKNEALLASRSSGNVGVVNNRVGNASSGVMAGGGSMAERSSVTTAERIDSSNEVLVAFNAVELREKEKLGELKPPSMVSGQPSKNGGPMDVDENGRMKVASSSNVMGSVSQDPAGGSVSERLGKMDVSENQNAQGEKASNGIVPVPSQDQMQGVENSHAGSQDNNNPQL